MKRAFPRAHRSSLSIVAETYALRCDAKQADVFIRRMLLDVTTQDYFYLSELLPAPFVKGVQPTYLDQPTDDSVPVINTLSIQNLSLNTSDCRHITREDFDTLAEERRVKKDDVLLTVDGGVSIGKPYLFSLDGEYTVDSHVVILRPEGIEPLSLVYLLASPLGQAQFLRAESGASGQTTVTEDDIRRFVFPRSVLSTIDKKSRVAEEKRQAIVRKREKLLREEQAIWEEMEIS